MLKVNRGSLISWMKRQNEVLTDEFQTLFERCLETYGEEHIHLLRTLYSGLNENFPRLLWTLDGENFHLTPAEPEECNWCTDQPLEEAHLCPKCWGSGIVETKSMTAIVLAYHFLLVPLRASRSR